MIIDINIQTSYKVTVYPNGLNENVRKHDSEVSVGKLFFSIPRTKQRSARCKSNKDYLKNDTITDFFTNIHNIIQNDIKDYFYKICIILNNLKKKILKQITPEILQNENILDKRKITTFTIM